MFRDGWFYPGDAGIMEDLRTLRLFGRSDDLLNFRGLKLAPQAMEENLMGELPVEDLCLTTIADEEGVNQLWVVVVPRNPNDASSIQEKLVQLLPPVFDKIVLKSLKKIPRTSTGKVRRNRLNEILRQGRG